MGGDTDVVRGVDRLAVVNSAGRILTGIVALVVMAGGCAVATEPASVAEPADAAGEAPLPTVGIDSELGVLTGGAEIREIDTGDVESVVMIGDSITVGAQPMIEEQFDALGFANVNVVAQTNKRTAVPIRDNSSGAEIAAFVASTDDRGDEQLWVIALGTNDISQYGSTEEFAADVRIVLDQIPEDAPVVWIDTFFASRPFDTEVVNEAIDQVLAERPNATVGEWSAIAGTDGVLRSDGVHPSTQGAEVFAAFVTTTVSDFLQR